MAVLRATPQGNTANCLDGIVQTAADLTGDSRLQAAALGSLMYCLADGKLYCKTGANNWTEAT